MGGAQGKMGCKKEGCEGIIDTSTPVLLQTGCSSVTQAFPCGECGRLHMDGSLVFNRQGEAAYWTGESIQLVKEGEPAKG